MAPCHHLAGDRLRDEEGSGDVHGQEPVPGVAREVDECRPVLDAGVVDEDLDRTDATFELVDGLVNLVAVGDVEE